jgi:cholesterol oxidase
VTDAWDAIVVGSGFGGAVTACRLAEKGWKVLVLERGRRWRPEEYPREADDDWLWDHERPERSHGWIDFRLSRGVCTVQGAGVGGGSLIYANVCIDAQPGAFEHGWPHQITYDELAPYYRRVEEMLAPSPVPDNQLTRRFGLMREGAERLGYGDRFRALPLAVTFDPEWHYGLDDPYAEDHSRPWTNEHGAAQGTCVHCGNCIAGCRVGARNTLEHNYLARAERLGAEIRPLHLVRFVAPDSPGYRVVFDRIAGGRLHTGSETGRKVILAAGSMGSTELLLRCRDQYRTLRSLSNMLGYGWSSNGDFLTFSFHDRPVDPTRGPTISSAIDLLDGAFEDQQLFIEDGGFPDAFRRFTETHRFSARNLGMSSLLYGFGRFLRRKGSLENMMIWFGQSVDAATGCLRLTRHPLKPWRKVLGVRWDREATERPVGAMIRLHQRLARATGGTFMVPHNWTLMRKLTTPHPLGGCCLGTRIQNGVVDHRGEVFGYPGLFVADGSIVPRAIGRNPSKTIAALAERIAELMAAAA